MSSDDEYYSPGDCLGCSGLLTNYGNCDNCIDCNECGTPQPIHAHLDRFGVCKKCNEASEATRKAIEAYESMCYLCGGNRDDICETCKESEYEESDEESEADFIADCPFCGGLVTIEGCTLCVICSCGEQIRDQRFPQMREL